MARAVVVAVVVLVGLTVSGLALIACASRSQRPLVRYPPRRPGCALAIYHTDLPDVRAWQDIGTVEMICHIDDTEGTCFGRFRAEACRLGGDIVYHLPVKVWRPRDEAIAFRGIVAHTTRAPEKELPVKDESDFPPPASPQEAAGPVVPLGAAPAPAVLGSDAGAGAPAPPSPAADAATLPPPVVPAERG